MSWVDDPCLQDQTLIQVAPVSLGAWSHRGRASLDLITIYYSLPLTESLTPRLIVNPPVLHAEIREATIANTQVCSRI